jgi:hypothetical protein
MHALRTHTFSGTGSWIYSGTVYGHEKAQKIKMLRKPKPILDQRTKDEVMPLLLMLPCLLLALVLVAVLVMLFMH